MQPKLHKFLQTPLGGTLKIYQASLVMWEAHDATADGGRHPFYSHFHF